MPHQCVKCGILYEDTAPELLKGCSCGAKFFFFVKPENLSSLKEETKKLTHFEREEIVEDVMDIIGQEVDQSMPVILNLESVRIRKPGKFEIDLVKVFKGAPLVYKIEEGKYFIDLPSSFLLGKKKKEKG